MKRFLERRLPMKTVESFLREPQPGNVGWVHTFGSALLVLLIAQILTGGILLLFYAPTPDHAWESLSYVEENLPSVAYLRSLHVWGASLLVLLATCHILRVVLHGSYKAPRELNWLSGMASFLVVLAFLFTGHLLPWDQKGYWDTEVGLEMIGRAPLGGELLRRLLQGGEEIGAYTLSRFFALHVFFLPGALLALVGIHLFLLRYHGIADHPDPARRTSSTNPFYPHQVFKDGIVTFLILWFLLTLALVAPAELDWPADPSDTSYDPRPEWYFLAHYELLRLFRGVEILPMFVIPNLIILALLLLPWIDRSEHRLWNRRKGSVSAVLVFFALLYGAVAYSRIYHPREGTAVAEQQLPFPEEGPPIQMTRARQVLIEQKCINCHRIQGVGGLQGPDLSQAGWKFNRQHLRSQILQPQLRNPDSKMPSFQGKISEEDLEVVVEYLSLMME